ncbi:metallophosphoesterase [Jutongia hominis]|jgi:calcineurin-like phosphoesterase family protein|uniref:Metallophosphoesterase n=1 Tax=Jutongia hominis TaxID=2763664 RepID=A0ABR7MVA1_9FIRM|nr:metallophosphoesterase [Jutongia hominis]MBC8557182.1 metallophosphoesterase [Jutongia hominis]
MKYYIADCHFGHEKVRQLDQRPFETVEQMDTYMIEQWNRVVKKNRDEVYILGDFCIGKGDQTNEVLSMLRGKKYLITGNHDQRFLRDKQFDASLFQWIKSYAEIHDNNRKVVLSHYPIICYHGQYLGDISYMLYGHVHDTMDYKNVRRFVRESRQCVYGSEQKSLSCNLINCFAGFSDFAPCTLDQWIKMEEEYS